MATLRMVDHLRNYASAGVLSAVVGLISFPIMTRNLSVADYGIVGLVSASITLFLAMGKLGMQHAVIRFFSQIKNANSAFSVAQLNSTVSMVFLWLACGITCLFLLLGIQILPGFLQHENIPSLFMLASAIVFVRLLGSGIMNFLRAQQRSAEVALAQSLARFLNLTLILAVLLLATLDPYTVVACLFVAELAGVGFAAWQYRAEFYFRRSDVSGELARAMLTYGLPLMILESLSLVLRLSDRYLIEALLGVDELGQYSASYNLSAYLDIIILASLLQAIRPAYVQLWEESGAAKTVEFLSRGFKWYIVLGIPLIVMFSITSPYLLSFLAGPKYAVGTVIIPYVALSFWLEGGLIFLGAGIYIYKNTKVLMFCSLLATVINLGLNILLIPKFGITGAAAVTVFSYAVFVMAVTVLAFRHVSFKVTLQVPAVVTVASIMVFAALHPISLGSDIYNFLAKGTIGTGLLLGVIWLLEPELRQWITGLPSRIKAGRQSGSS